MGNSSSTFSAETVQADFSGCKHSVGGENRAEEKGLQEHTFALPEP